MKLVRAGSSEWIEGIGYRSTIVLDAADVDQAGALVMIVHVPPQTGFGLHHHDRATEVFHITSGSATMRIGDSAVILATGDTVTCEPGEFHDARNDNDEPFEYVVFKTNWVPGDTEWD